jgi:hypothetical protein
MKNFKNAKCNLKPKALKRESTLQKVLFFNEKMARTEKEYKSILSKNILFFLV